MNSGGGFPATATVTLTDPSMVYGAFGGAVALSADATTLAIGAAGTGGNHGAVYVYIKRMNAYPTDPTTTLPDTGTGPDELGNALALSGDGSTLAVGAANVDSTLGAVYVYIRSGGAFPTTPTSALTGPRTMYAAFGQSVSLSDNGATLVVGANGASNGRGAAYIYVKSGGGFPDRAATTLIGPSVGQTAFGLAVALSADGTTLVVGAYATNGAYVYVKNGSTFPAEPTSSLSNNMGNFGQAVTVSATGNVLAVGAYGANMAFVYANLPPPTLQPMGHANGMTVGNAPTSVPGGHTPGPMSGSVPMPQPRRH